MIIPVDNGNGGGNCGQFFQDPLGIVMLVLIGLLIVAMIVVPIISRRKRKAASDDLDSNLTVGDKVLTAGGVIGNIIELREGENGEREVVVETGLEGQKTTIVFDARGILQNLTRPPTPTNFLGMPKKQKDENTEELQDDGLVDIDTEDLEVADAPPQQIVEAETITEEAGSTVNQTAFTEEPSATVEPSADAIAAEAAPVVKKTTRTRKSTTNKNE